MKKTFVFAILFHITISVFSQESDRKLIENLRSQWTNYLKTKAITDAVNQYTDDAIFFSPGGKNAYGKNEITTLYRQAANDFTSELHFVSLGVIISGNIASDCGTYTETLYNLTTKKNTEIKGSYLMVLIKQKSHWKIKRIMWT